MRIVFIGPPGAGKGTQAVLLAERLGVTHLSTGEVLRAARTSGDPLGRQAAEYLDDGRLVPDELVVKLVADRLAAEDCEKGYLFDGFPRTLPQAQELDRLLGERGERIELALEFVISFEELTARLGKRGRSDDGEDTVRRRLEVYASHTRPLAEYYNQRGVLRRIQAVGGVDDVTRRVWRAVQHARSGDS